MISNPKIFIRSHKRYHVISNHATEADARRYGRKYFPGQHLAVKHYHATGRWLLGTNLTMAMTPAEVRRTAATRSIRRK